MAPRASAGDAVVIDAQVFLRIAKHAKQVYPSGASGSLMGLADEYAGGKVSVSSCFGYARKGASDENLSYKDQMRYELEMINLLKGVNLDTQTVGWYTTTHHGNLFNEAFVENQYAFQSEIPGSVCLVYDKFKTAFGSSGYRAYRLTAEAMEQRMSQEGDSHDPFTEFSSSKLFEEVPIEVYCSPYTEAFLLQCESRADAQAREGLGFSVASSDLPSESVQAPAFNQKGRGKGQPQQTEGAKNDGGLERNVTLLLETVEEYTLQQREMQMYERSLRQNKVQPHQRVPKSLDALNLAKQIQEHSANLDSFCMNTFAKLYLCGSAEETEAKDALQELKAMQGQGA